MKRKVNEFIQSNDLITDHDRILIGVSGGRDSLALLFFLKHYEKPMDLGVAHLHHGLRGKAADVDLDFVKTIAAECELPFYEKHVDLIKIAQKKGWSIEEAGREERRLFFLELCEAEAYNKVALGHHMNDQAETILMRLIRGTGPVGAGGIQPKSDGVLQIVRPLLCVTREEIDAYVRQNSIAYRDDHTNDDNLYTRNLLRNEIIPKLQEINPETVTHLAHFGEMLSEQNAYIHAQTDSIAKEIISFTDREASYYVADLNAQTPAVKKALLRRGIQIVKGSLKEVEYNHILKLSNLLESPNTTWKLDLPGQIQGIRSYDTFSVTQKKSQKDSAIHYGVYPAEYNKTCYYAAEKIWVTIVLKNVTEDILLKLPEKAEKKDFNYDRIVNTLEIRTRREGDFFYPVGMTGSKKLKKYLIDKKVPREKRDSLYLLADGQEIVWIFGYAVNRRYLLNDESGRVITVAYGYFGKD